MPTPTPSAIREAVEAKIREAVPKIEEHKFGPMFCFSCGQSKGTQRMCWQRPLHLQDVLIALNESNHMFRDDYPRKDYQEWHILDEIIDKYDLTKPLSQQSDETMLFLHSKQ